jgi:hypothetical protein
MANDTLNFPDGQPPIPTLPLSQKHFDILHASAINDDVIGARGYRTITDANELHELGFSPAQCRVPGLLLPVHTTDGGNSPNVYRPDSPRVLEDKKKKNPDGTHPNKVLKYEMPKGESVRLDCPPVCQPMLSDPSIPLWITEGQKKADALVSARLCAIALLGVWNFKGKNEFGASTILADWDYIALKNRDVRIVFDSDVMTKPAVRLALNRLTEHLQRKGATVAVVYLPNDLNKGKVGVDDWLAAGHTVDELNRLVDAPHPLPKPAPDEIVLLDKAPATITRPLKLIDGRAYAATWLYAQTTRREGINKQGEIVKYDPPIVFTEQRLFIIPDDGAVFGDTNNPLENLPLEIHLAEIPQDTRLWNTPGVTDYVAGNRPDPMYVFQRLVDVVDRFIDFTQSLASQLVMCEAIACYILATWFFDAFNVLGYIWSNGERGSGKTNLLIVVTELAYLGQLITASGTFAALRDLADYGATLAFDDAENLSDPKSTDPDKRSLILAGNRRGVTVPLKELGPDKLWHTRHVNAFCPRLFSAIRLPDSTLASRAIIIPLIRTTDRSRANVDPSDLTIWPHNRRELIDDLWALALAHLHELPRWDTWVGNNAQLTGRNLQPWRAILAVAAWLDSCGVHELWQRMEGLSLDYQNQRPELEVSDFTILVIRSLLDWAVANVTNVTDVTNQVWEFTTAQITENAVKLAKEMDGDIDPEKVKPQRVGQVFRRMRLSKPSRPRGQKARIWKVTLADLIRLANGYGIPLPAEFDLSDKQDTSQDIGNIGDIGDIGNTTDNEFDLLRGSL